MTIDLRISGSYVMKTHQSVCKKQPGLSLVELIISMALMGMVVLSVANFVMKGTATAGSLNMRFSEVSEIQMLINDIQLDLQKGAIFGGNGSDKRLDYSTYNSSGAAVRKIYRIYTDPGTNLQYLQLSNDGGTTWISPYRVSSYNQYVLKGNPRFLYSWSMNNCTDFPDTNNDGFYNVFYDGYASSATCPGNASTVTLINAGSATKVDL